LETQEYQLHGFRVVVDKFRSINPINVVQILRKSDVLSLTYLELLLIKLDVLKSIIKSNNLLQSGKTDINRNFRDE